MADNKNKELKWKVIHSNSFDNVYDFLDTILIQNGVNEDDIDDFLHPTQQLKKDASLLKNIDKAIQMLHDHVRKKDNILVKVDCDVDGYCSASMIILFIKFLDKDIQVDYILNYDKQHGLTYQDMSNYTKDKYGLVIIPDASMTVENARNISKNFSSDILVLDHHIIEEEYFDEVSKHWVVKTMNNHNNNEPLDCYTNYCLSVNCTDGIYPNPHLCGAGVVQKFIEYYIKNFSISDRIDIPVNYFSDLVSLALISDGTDLRSLENRYYVFDGFRQNNYRNKFINALVERNQEDMKYGRYITSMGWNIAPKINGCIRYGKPDELDSMFRAILDIDETVIYQPRRKSRYDPVPDPIEQTIQEAMARVCDNVKARQDTEVRKFVKDLEEKIEEEHLDKNSVIFIDGTNIITTATTTGLVANKLASTYFRPVVLFRSKNASEYGGSMRGYDKGVIDDTKSFLEKAGITCMGHSNAAGILLKKDELQNVIDKCNEMLPIDQLTTVYTVDWQIDASKLKNEYVEEVASNYSVFGSTVPEPLFAITNIHVNAENVQAFGENKSFIRFTANGIQYSKKYCSRNEFDLMTFPERGFGPNKKELEMNIIGQFTYNVYDDKLYPEVKIVAFESKEVGSKHKDETIKIKDFDEENYLKKTNDKKDYIKEDDFEW